MARSVDEDELIEHWTLVGDELVEVAGKRGPTRLGFAILLKFYSNHGRFPRGRGEVPAEAISYIARQVDVPAVDLGFYEWSGRTFEYHRAQVRKFLGFRECTVADADKLAAWLAEHVCRKERQPERVREELLRHCRGEGIEPPTPDRVGRIIGSGLRAAEQALTAQISGRVPSVTASRLAGLVEAVGENVGDLEMFADVGDDAQDDPVGTGDGNSLDVFAAIRTDPGNVSVKTITTEVFKLEAIRAVGLPSGLFADIAPKVLAGWRTRVASEFPSHLREHPPEIKVTLLAAYLHCRQREITDALVDMLITTVRR